MKRKAFIDSDVILDVLAKRSEHYSNSAKIFSLIETNQIQGFVSPLIFSNIYYILRKLKSKEIAIQCLQKLNMIINVIPIDAKVIDKALSSTFSDFEDAIQYYAAKETHISFIITRNIKDYKNADIPTFSPDEFLKFIKSN